ncbi:hypothetical protein AMS68_004151 [Peltaster fructicola]|uniref:Uncharacterized protein n=1 Tax=Peltaster fructicola TaxID=286661 RepID=A0A6H0XV72_9PEZI|nr:hypothetical protein AMS68_004151 [Peltaster fructicola]
MSFKSLIAPVSARPKSQFFVPAGGHGLLRDQFSIPTWLALGGIMQGLLFLVAGRLALVPVVLLLGYSAADTYLMTIGWKKNIYMEDVLQKKYSAQIPDAAGNFSDKPADSQVVVFMLGVRNNHPLGLLAPGMKELGVFFPSMAKNLEEHADEFGYLGMTAWQATGQRTTQNEIMNVAYFRDYDGLHKFAHSQYHREAWAWFNKESKRIGHISIWHETYAVPKGNWESIYINSKINNLASTTYKITDQSTGEDLWASPVVDASRGLLKTSKGRMSRSNATENDAYEKNEVFDVDY